jgi:two-component system chemotaxis response regulator CheB
VVAIGASTGGPGAVAQVLRDLPAQFQLPILLVVHIGEPFAPTLADWLDRQSTRRVSHPRDGDPVASVAGRVAMAPPGRHLVVRGGRLHLSHDPERNWCRPSVDVLFESVAAEYGAGAAGCLLTGMGRDGAAGLLAIRNAGGATMSQDAASCVVFGMPREAELLGASMRVLPLGEIGAAIAALEARP